MFRCDCQVMAVHTNSHSSKSYNEPYNSARTLIGTTMAKSAKTNHENLAIATSTGGTGVSPVPL
jgi:hypothetical protein